MSSENEFDKGDAGSSKTELTEAGRAKPGSLVMIKDFPCKVTAFSTAKPGKHGSAKAMLTGKDIFTDKQYEETFGTGDMIPKPIVTKTEYQCIDVVDGFLSLMQMDTGEMKEDIKLPSEEHLNTVAKRIKEIVDAGKKECLVTVQVWGEKEQACAVREGGDAWFLQPDLTGVRDRGDTERLTSQLLLYSTFA